MHTPKQYDEVIDRVSRRPIKAAIGLPLFLALFTIAIFAKNLLGAEYAGLVLLLLIIVFPFYIVQLAMKWRMQKHQSLTKSLAMPPRYVPSNITTWAGFYVGAVFVTGFLVIGCGKLFELVAT